MPKTENVSQLVFCLSFDMLGIGFTAVLKCYNKFYYKIDNFNAFLNTRARMDLALLKQVFCILNILILLLF